MTRLPIRKSILSAIVKQVKEHLEGNTDNQQPYLSLLYRTLFTIAYYGMFRIGELTSGSHPVRAQDVQVSYDKKKLLFTLHTSKTHGLDSEPQRIKISSVDKEKTNKRSKHLPCPYQLMREYGKARGPYQHENDPFFVFSDGSRVTPAHFRACLKLVLEKAGYNPALFSGHSFRIGRSNDLLKLGLSVETIKKLGRWKSNAVFKYLKY